MKGPELSVIIVSFNTRDKLARCLAAIPSQFEVVVVDNDSKDGSADMVASEFSSVRLIRNAANIGFGRACNQGLAAATAPSSLLLNSDCYAEPGAIELLLSVFRGRGATAAGGRLVHPDRRLQWSCGNELTLWAVLCEQLYLEKLFPNSKLFSPYWMSHRLKKTAEVAQVMGACLLVPSNARFDERFPLYCEDTELCYTLRKGGPIYYVPDACFIHDLGSSSSGSRWRSVALYNRGKELFFSIHHGKWPAAACWLLNRLGALLRLIVWGIPALLTLGLISKFRIRAWDFVRVFVAPIKGPRL